MSPAWLVGIAVLFFILYEEFMTKNLDAWPAAPSVGIGALARAIAVAENSPTDWNNPGSLTAGDVPSDQITGVGNSAGVVTIDTLENGVNALYNKLARIANGQSSVYSSDMSLSDFAGTYTGASGDVLRNYADTLSQETGASPDTSLSDVLNGG